ncbi:MAG: septal ring lytic transglycosylase RlpA family protein [Desulfovibrionaceae bacterium]
MQYVTKHLFLVFLSVCLLAAPAHAGKKAQQNTAQPENKQSSWAIGQKMTGVSAWYGKKAQGNSTASGKRFDSTKLTAAHRTLPFGTMVKVTNKKNKKCTVVQITDRGPSSKKYIIDISRQAAIAIGMLKQGVADVTLEIVSLPPKHSRKRAQN